MSPARLGHEGIEQLLGAFVLHAVDADEFEMIARHLEGCPRCSAEVDDRNEVAAALGNVQAVVPDQLWNRIAGQLGDQLDALAPVAVDGGAAAAIVRFDGAPRRSRRSRLPASKEPSRPGRLTRFTWAGVVAAAAVIALLAVDLSSANGRLAHDQSAVGARTAQASIRAALAAPGHQVVEMSSNTNAHLAELVLSAGVGYAVHSAMPTLPADETYQLWATIGGQPISLGLFGNRVEPGAAFSLRSERGHPVALLVTVEPAGGVVVPDRAAIATGRVI